MSGYRIGQDWSRHDDVLKRVRPRNGRQIKTPALDEVVKWVFDQCSDEVLDAARAGKTPPELKSCILMLRWKDVVDALEELWELRETKGYIDPLVIENPALLLTDSPDLPGARSPQDMLRSLILHVVVTRIKSEDWRF